MYCVPQTSLNRKQAKKQIIATAFLVLFIVVSLFPKAFILTRANHTHDQNGVGGTCITCAVLQNTENLLKQLGAAATGAFFSLAVLFTTSAIIRAICSNIALLTPITLKIRMNN